MAAGYEWTTTATTTTGATTMTGAFQFGNSDSLAAKFNDLSGTYQLGNGKKLILNYRGKIDFESFG